jgi:hypothetical protein
MRRFLVALMLVVSVVVCGFSRQYVRTYIRENSSAQRFVLYVNEQISAELRFGSSVVSIAPILDNCNGSYTVGIIVLYDDGE